MTIGSQSSIPGVSTELTPLVLPSPGVPSCVIEITERLFGGPVSIRIEDDPEFPSRYFVISSPVSGEVEEIVAKVNDWHRQVRAELGDAICDYRLLVEPR